MGKNSKPDLPTLTPRERLVLKHNKDIDILQNRIEEALKLHQPDKVIISGSSMPGYVPLFIIRCTCQRNIQGDPMVVGKYPCDTRIALEGL